jgi:hypothetical protein
MKNLLLTACAGAVISAGSAAPGSAHSTVAFMNDPIRIARVADDPSASTRLFDWGSAGLTIGTDDYTTVSFVNDGELQATSVAFAVTSGKTTQIIVDRGVFSPGATITHDLKGTSLFEGTPAIDVEQVTFADGTVWKRG